MENTSENKDLNKTEKSQRCITVGILAQVDAGKTTFSEQLLFHGGAIRSPGRVDRQDTMMDGNEIEKQRGITIFTDQAYFTYGGVRYYLLDTPGHVDFGPEAERALGAMDCGVLLLDASSAVSARAVTLFKLLRRWKKPVFFFLNKMDMEGASVVGAMESIRNRLTENVIFLDSQNPFSFEGEAGECLAERDEGLLEQYLEGGIDPQEGKRVLARLLKEGELTVAMAGSALRDHGIQEFLQLLGQLVQRDYNPEAPFGAFAYKVRRTREQRLVYLKILSGRLKPRDTVTVSREGQEPVQEKIHQIYQVMGSRYIPCAQAQAGELVAVSGLQETGCGTVLGRTEGTFPGSQMVPSLETQVLATDGTDDHRLLEILKSLEDEEPQLQAESRKMADGTIQVCVQVMGTIQLEVLKELMSSRFGVLVEFAPPRVLYRETIAKPVMGYGHYEPLRHYAEACLLLEPGERGSGITFESRCHVDVLAANYQSLIRTHVFERVHRGILTGSPLTDVKVVLMDGRSHLKHTEGGDFRQAVYRAIRQGLEKADNVLLEPWYEVEISAPAEAAGRIMAELSKRFAQLSPMEQYGNQAVIRGRGPVACLMDFSRELASMTRGEGTLSMGNAGYFPCHNQEEVIREIGYDKEGDPEHTSASVFCSHGAGFAVPWNEVEQYIHSSLRIDPEE